MNTIYTVDDFNELQINYQTDYFSSSVMAGFPKDTALKKANRFYPLCNKNYGYVIRTKNGFKWERKKSELIINNLCHENKVT